MEFSGIIKRLLYIMCVVAVIAMSGGATHAAKPAKLYRNSYALLIGVNQYPKLPKDKWLQYSVNDVTSLRKILINSYGFRKENVKILVDAKATRAGIEQALAELADSDTIKTDDRVLIYFSGHGQTVKALGGEMGFLLPYDASVKLSDMSNAGPFMKTCLPMSRVWEYLQPCPAKHVLILADVCYSGLLAQNRGLEDMSNSSVQVLAKTPARQVITAGGKGQTSVEKSQWGHGAFTYKLLEKLTARTAVPGKVFTAQDLFTEVQRGVSNITEGKQTPQLYNKDTEGEFLFVPTGKSAAMENSEPEVSSAVITPAVIYQTIAAGSKIGDIATNPKDDAEMVWVPDGAFLMGSSEEQIAKVLSGQMNFEPEWYENERPQHKVYLNGYWIYKNEVTVAQYKRFCQENKREMPGAPDWGWVDSHPMVMVTWQDAVEYAKWAGGSLPTEAQWEKAARGTDGRTYPWGDFWNGSISTNGIGGLLSTTQPAGIYPAGASQFGCLDIAGNVWEWCEDRYSKDYYSNSSAENPTGPVDGDNRILRGGSWFNQNTDCFRCAFRYNLPSTKRVRDTGFRCVRTPESK